MLNVPMRLMLIVRAKPASECGPSLPTTFSPWTMPAQLTSPCSRRTPRCAAATAALRARLVGDVGADEARLRAELLRERLPFRLLEVGDDDVAAAGDDHARGRRAQSRRAAGDDERAALEFHVCICFACCVAVIVGLLPP